METNTIHYKHSLFMIHMESGAIKENQGDNFESKIKSLLVVKD